MTYFGVVKLLNSLWNIINESSNTKNGNILKDSQEKINNFTLDINEKLKKIYFDIKNEFSIVSKYISMNEKQAKKLIKNFKDTITNTKKFIPEAPIIKNTSEILLFIDKLSKDLSELNVIHEFWRLVIDEKVVFMSENTIED